MQIKVETIDDGLGLFGNLGNGLFFNRCGAKNSANSSKKYTAGSLRKMEENVHDQHSDKDGRKGGLRGLY